MKIMKNILVLMDFSSVAMNAFKYAYKLFREENLTVIHTDQYSGKNPEFIGAKPGQTKCEFLEGELNSWIKHELDLETLPKNISINVLKGNPLDKIKQVCKEYTFDCLVMGTRDKYSLMDKWLGTVSLSIVKSIDIPIYVIPRYSKYTTFDQVVVSTDSNIKENKVLEKIAKWNEDHSAFLNFLHINKDSSDEISDETDAIVTEYFENNNYNFGFEISSTVGDDVGKTILASAYNKQANLIILLPHEQTFLNSMMINSISKQMILSSTIPMLFMKLQKVSNKIKKKEPIKLKTNS